MFKKIGNVPSKMGDNQRVHTLFRDWESNKTFNFKGGIMPKASKDIEITTGEINANIILIAPNCKGADQTTTARLTRAIQKRLGCHAIINEAFTCPPKTSDGKFGDADIEKRIADLNHINHAKKHSKFISTIKKWITDPANAHVFLIYGIEDETFSAESKKWGYNDAKCLVGYGQGAGNGLSMNADKAKQLVQLMIQNGLLSAETHQESPDFRGASPEVMNQYFNLNSTKFPGVQSVQLGFAKAGVREKWFTVQTGIKVTKAIAELVGCETVDIPEENADEDLVQETTAKVKEFIAANHKNSIQVGHYLIEKFYGNDYEKAKKGQKVKGKSLNAMIEGLEKIGNAPSKSWFYNAVNLAVDDKAFEGDADYAKLNLSHKIYLTYLNTKDEWETAKLGLIKEIAKNGTSIQDLGKKIASIKGKSETDWPEPDFIKAMADKEKMKYKDRAEKRKIKIEETIKALTLELEKCEKIITAVVGTTEQTEEVLKKTGTDG
ncbi:hypothetical protein [Desulfatitalea tepidiphila]|uniref:hypothetical protein n=1 Tax=Desulfatitalea tepidiphila TaxID=1185843 RepID=UPI0006B63087|nr:hypothetical protein [Desulfatitalea tepidiphila]